MLRKYPQKHGIYYSRKAQVHTNKRQEQLL